MMCLLQTAILELCCFLCPCKYQNGFITESQPVPSGIGMTAPLTPWVINHSLKNVNMRAELTRARDFMELREADKWRKVIELYVPKTF